MPHGCKEGQCASCKSILIDGEVDLKKYSTFALNDMERDQEHILLCRTLAFSDLEIELLNYRRGTPRLLDPGQGFRCGGHRRHAAYPRHPPLEITIDKPLKFWAGQYVDITLPDQAITRSFSMANPPGEAEKLAFIIKRYEGGAFSGQLDGGLAVGTEVQLRGPYGTCFRREGRDGPLILVGGGSGMSPLWSILQDHVESGEERPVRFFYGARTEADLFYLDEIKALGEKLATSSSSRHSPISATMRTGAASAASSMRFFESTSTRFDLDDEGDAYTCGPPPMIDAVIPVLQIAGLDGDRIFFDKFTQASG